MIDGETGALTVREGPIPPDITRSALFASPVALGSTPDDMRTGWVHITLAPQLDDRWTWGVRLLFDGERLDATGSGSPMRVSARRGTTGPRTRSSRGATPRTRGSSRSSGLECVSSA
jgi:hypothetical protein